MTPAFDDPRLERLASKLSEASSNGAVTLAYSGGLDSRFLAFFAKLAGFRVRLLHVTGPHVAPAETAEAVAEQTMGLEAELVPLDPRTCPTSPLRDALRCYVCQAPHLHPGASQDRRRRPLCDGTNHSDLAVYRPSPQGLEDSASALLFAEADIPGGPDTFGAADFRNPGQMARPCLLTRFPYGMKPASRDPDTRSRRRTAVEALMKEDDRLRATSFRCPLPGRRQPRQFISATSVSHAEDTRTPCRRSPEKLGGVHQGFIELVDRLSRWFDRPVRN